MARSIIPHVIQLTGDSPPAGAIGIGGDKHYNIMVTVPNAIWVVIHNLGKKPAVTVTNDNDKQIEAEIIYDNQNQCTIRFNSPQTGNVYLN